MTDGDLSTSGGILSGMGRDVTEPEYVDEEFPAHRRRGPGLTNRWNRVALAILTGWLIWMFLGVLDIASPIRLVLFLAAAAGAYTLITKWSARNAL